MSQSTTALIISGATASGKSALALKIAKEHNGEIINADALQIYQELPILSAQPTFEEKSQIKHHLYGFLDHKQDFSVANWLDLVRDILPKIWQKNKLPIIVGGSGMYISKLIEGMSPIAEISIENKEKAQQDFANLGLDKIVQIAQTPNIQDKQRAIRAYEVLLETGNPITFWQKQEKKLILPQANFKHFNINLKRTELYDRCNSRFEIMLKQGALDEARNIMNQISTNSNICNTLGFKEIEQYLLKKMSYEEMIEKSCQKTRNYAKRQLTWFRNQLQQNNERHLREDIMANPQYNITKNLI